MLYSSLFMLGKLRLHLHGIDVAIFERWGLIIKQMMESQNVTEQLKEENPMLWFGKVNNIRNCADEIIRSELIYE